MDPEQQKKLAEELEKRDKIFVEAIDKQHKILKESHTKKEFTFSTVEKRRLLQQESMILMINQAMDDIINLSVLPRLGFVTNASIKVLYDVSLGKFIVWQPKNS